VGISCLIDNAETQGQRLPLSEAGWGWWA